MMTVRRIVANIAADSVRDVRAFYADLFGLEAVMDLGWIVTLTSGETALAQMSILGEGGSGAPVPDLSIEVDDVDAVYARAKEIGCPVVHELRDEPWGVRRFFITDPTGKVLNVLSHLGGEDGPEAAREGLRRSRSPS
jgi:predicted enzyme related to lactoylglutathione lyase